MKKKIKTFFFSFFFILIGVGLGYFFYTLCYPKAPSFFKEQSFATLEHKKEEKMHVVSLGDSLTEGVGDPTQSGGFVPILKKEIEFAFPQKKVYTKNFGKSGDTSVQILTRLKENKEQQKALQNATLITLTVGGNDLMKTAKKDILKDIQLNHFITPSETYQKNLIQLIKEIRSYSPKAPLYIVGIYNPFYLYFKDITALQQVVELWNNTTKKVTKKENRLFFIETDALLSKGSFKEETTKSEDTSDSTSTSSLENDLLYTEDHFHPNGRGYQKLAQALFTKMKETKKLW